VNLNRRRDFILGVIAVIVIAYLDTWR